MSATVNQLQGKRVLLIVGGGIAAYKSLELVRRLRAMGASVGVVMTAGAKQFVQPLSFASLSGEAVHDTLFDLTQETEIGHIQLSRRADLLVVAPATADIMAKAAQGLAGDLATTLLLATDKPVLMAPAMNVRMWHHPATQRNLARLMADGVTMVGPDEGDMACGEFGLGRMAEPEVIAAAVLARLTPGDRPLAGRHVLVTAGPTHEPIDPVRYIANRSSGKQGIALAAALHELGARVSLILGPSHEPIPPGPQVTRVETARQMLAAVEAALPADAAVFAAAVADWRVDHAADQKLKKDGSGCPPSLSMVENPDILSTIAHLPAPRRPLLVVGFAAETHDVLAHATAKRLRKGCDWIVANDVSGDVMGGTDNRISLITAQGVEHWPRQSKAMVAQQLAARIAAALRGVAQC